MKQYTDRERKARPGKKKHTGRIVAGILLALAVLAMVLPFVGSILIYESNFNRRFETDESARRYVEDYEGLNVEECTFASDRGQKLAGYLYSKGSDGKKGLLVFAHGFGGGGHNSYLELLYYFASNDYLVFTYDATGNDKSEGTSVRGLPQGVIDLDYALRYVESREEWKDLPLVLLGHSWGAYSICSVLEFHPDVRAVASCSGFDSSLDMIEAEGRKLAGDGISLLLPFLSFYERIKFGAYADSSSMTGFAGSKARVMAIHSMDDTIVPPRYGFEKYVSAYREDERFTFVRFEGRGHNHIFHTGEPEERCLDEALLGAIKEFFDESL